MSTNSSCPADTVQPVLTVRVADSEEPLHLFDPSPCNAQSAVTKT